MNKLGKALTKAETIELQYFYLSGCRYITKGGFNYTSVWRVKPTLQKNILSMFGEMNVIFIQKVNLRNLECMNLSLWKMDQS